MKIHKFNENLINPNYRKDCWICIITSGIDIVYSGAFETKTDMNNWLLNLINEELDAHIVNGRHTLGIITNEDDEKIFIDVENAVNWFKDYFNYMVYYEESQYIKNETLLYGVELARTTNKYNI